jgi:ectoine hydroxylase-related dioxygenase (phytanoyl-CoA dioxygenase family)
MSGVQGATGAEPLAKRPCVSHSNGVAAAIEMSAEAKFFFDLNGFLVVRDVLTADEVAAANAAIDVHTGEILERKGELRNTRMGSPLGGDGSSGRRDLAGLLEWQKPHCDPFRSWLAHPKLLPYLIELCGEGYRMDHLPFVILQSIGSEGFQLHGGPLTGKGKLNPSLQYRCEDGAFFNSLVGMSVQLSDHNPGDGGFCVVRGSHKMKFPLPEAFRHGEIGDEHLHQPTTRAGDVVFFSEATVHGAKAWTASHERRVALYRFAPPTCAYGRTYSPQWPAAMLEGLTAKQRAVLEPPYANRLDRPLVRQGKEDTIVESRAEVKKEFDRAVFKAKYF